MASRLTIEQIWYFPLTFTLPVAFNRGPRFIRGCRPLVDRVASSLPFYFSLGFYETIALAAKP